jgi:NhaP-type Na+/H+ or K+/H+ antiporter
MQSIEVGEHARESLVNCAIIILSLIALYHVVGNFIKRKNLVFGHEASLIVIVGMLISYFLNKNHPGIIERVTFDTNIFFYGCLPPIIFASVYNMNMKIFFDNFEAVIIFGVLGTILQFLLFSIGLYFLNSLTINFFKIVGANSLGFNLSLYEILLMCSLICSSDPVAAISVIRYDQQPKLFSVVVGEGITNDAVGIIIFNTVLQEAAPGSRFSVMTFIKIVGSFVLLCVVSTVIGFIVGIIGSLTLKTFRGISHNPILETITIMGFGFLSYLVAERVEFSGIISVLSAAFTLRAFGEPNLSDDGKHHTAATLEFVGALFEGFVFTSIGLSFGSFVHMPWSMQLSIGMFFNVLIFRFIGVFLIIGLSQLVTRRSVGLNYKDLIFISYAG